MSHANFSAVVLCAALAGSSCGSAERTPEPLTVRDAGLVDDAGPADAGQIDAGSDRCPPGERARWQAVLNTRFHGVRGRVTITDACTLTVSGFSYDGQGIDVRFVVTKRGESFSTGLPVGPQLFRPTRPWADETLEFTLPPGMTTRDLEAISVWCVAASVDFGSGAFAPP
ncbi:MAG: DM13 domain-containing protein [Archangium sp.]